MSNINFVAIIIVRRGLFCFVIPNMEESLLCDKAIFYNQILRIDFLLYYVTPYFILFLLIY